jgi:hypothetical protein
MLIVEEGVGGLFLHPATAVSVRDIPKAQIRAWITRDEADMTAAGIRSSGTTRVCPLVPLNTLSERRGPRTFVKLFPGDFGLWGIVGV